MNKRFSLQATAAVCCFGVSLAAAAATPGWYFGIEGGASFLNDSDGSLQAKPNFNPGGGGAGGTPGGGFLIIPGLLTLFPSPGGGGVAGAPGSLVPGQRAKLKTKYDTGYIGGLTLGYLTAIGIRPELELRYAHNSLDKIKAGGGSNNANGDFRNESVMANVWYDFFRSGSIHPYIGGGIGAARLDLDTKSINGGFHDQDIRFAYQGGVGVSYDFTERATADLGYRYYATDDPKFSDRGLRVDSEYKQNVALLSLRYVFAPSSLQDSDNDGVPDVYDKCPNTPEGTEVGSDGCPLDSDGDGVPDYKDKCPGTPKGVPVNADGCPLDSDGDGVPDYKDNCPNTPAGTKVNAQGCAEVIDSDGDGVPDDQDLCPNTPPGQPVLTNGCAAGQSAILQGVNFEFNKATLTSSARDILENVVETLKDSPGFNIEIAGYTDSIGSAGYNQALSERRAASVRRYLINHGVDGGRLTAKGFGETHPIAPNTNPDGSDNPTGRATNRRVELHVIKQ